MEPMSFQNHVHRLRPIVKEVDPRYLRVLSYSLASRSWASTRAAGNKTHDPEPVPQPLGRVGRTAAVASQNRQSRIRLLPCLTAM